MPLRRRSETRRDAAALSGEAPRHELARAAERHAALLRRFSSWRTVPLRYLEPVVEPWAEMTWSASGDAPDLPPPPDRDGRRLSR